MKFTLPFLLRRSRLAALLHAAIVVSASRIHVPSNAVSPAGDEPSNFDNCE